MRQLTPVRGMVRRLRRGAVLTWTTVITIPTLFFAIGLAVDFTRIIVADREMATATHAAALAGAYQFDEGKRTINASRAQAAAKETLCVSKQHGALRNSDPGRSGRSTCPQGGSIAASVSVQNRDTVRVTSRYQVNNLVMFSLFGVQEKERSVVRAATICDPQSTTGPTSGYCTRPGI